ncbi:MAG: M81 family metallopeptidase [Candidatus Latescibacteria bacterium]|nr:M81 family metallopeptidase [Candidatus Latescibacterota bacterium]
MKGNNANRRKFLKTASIGSLGAASAVSSQAISAPAILSGKKRIMVGRFSDETNTFIPHKRTLAEAKRGARYGNDVIRRSGGCMGGFADICEMFDVELIGSIGVGGNHRLMEEEVFDYVTGYMVDTLDKNQVDAVYLAVHGGGCTEGHDDLEGETLEIIRKKVGPDIPIMFTMDLHCQVTPLMTQVADAVRIYRTYPHVDGFECGLEVGSIMMATLQNKIKPVMAVKKLPLMIGPPINVVTADEPIRRVYARAREMQRTIPGVLSVNPAHGFMQQDIPTQGVGVLVTTDGDKELAQKLADEIGDMMFSQRKDYWIHLPDAEEGVKLALKSDKPVAIADGGDNMGAGGSGDGTHLFRELLRQNVKSAVIQIHDAEAAKIAAAKGEGATVTVDVGGKSDPLNGSPVTVTGKISRILYRENNTSPAVRMEVGGVTLLINSRRIGPNNQRNLREIGINTEKYQMTVCKGGFAFRPAYPSTIFNYIVCETPGYSSTKLDSFTWKRIPRPMYPLDDI